MPPRRMSLTPELVARCHRTVEDSGPEPGLAYLDDEDYEEMLDATLAERPAGLPVWLFAYGSLIWRPEFEHVEERLALARGWHRAFCIKMTRWRGTLDRPGLMMGSTAAASAAASPTGCPAGICATASQDCSGAR